MTQLNKKVRLPSILTSAVSGTIGSVIAEAALFPLDTIKLRVQTQSADDAIGWLGMVVKVLSDEGISGFYKGLSGSFVKETLHSMSFWLFHELLFRNFTKTGDNSKTHEMRRLLLNLLAKQLNWLCTTPFEVVASLNQLSGEGFFPYSAEALCAGWYRHVLSWFGNFIDSCHQSCHHAHISHAIHKSHHCC